MNHHLAKSYRKKRFIFIAVVVFAVLFFLMQKGLLRFVNPFFSKIVSPIWQAENFTADFLAKSFSSKNDLYKQNILLKEELEKKDVEIDILQNLKKENTTLKEILGRVPRERHVILSAILAKPNQTPYDSIIVDKGSLDGVSPGQFVFSSGDVLIGEVDSVQKDSSQILMYSTPGNISQVMLADTGKYFNARGLGNGTFLVEVTRDTEVEEGDIFFYPGLDNALVGTAKKIEFDPRDAFKKVFVKSLVNIQEARWVEIKI